MAEGKSFQDRYFGRENGGGVTIGPTNARPSVDDLMGLLETTSYRASIMAAVTQKPTATHR
jgi:hypothetical protein